MIDEVDHLSFFATRCCILNTPRTVFFKETNNNNLSSNTQVGKQDVFLFEKFSTTLNTDSPFVSVSSCLALEPNFHLQRNEHKQEAKVH